MKARVLVLFLMICFLPVQVNAAMKYISAEETMKILNEMYIAQGSPVTHLKSADTEVKGWKAHLFSIQQGVVNMPLVTYVNDKEIVVGLLIRSGKLVVPKIPIEEMQPAMDMSNTKISSDRRTVFNKAGKELLYMFTDSDCPYCQSTEEALSRYKGKYKVVLKHFPLEAIHPAAKEKAINKQCIHLGAHCDRRVATQIVEEDIQEGMSLGVDGTPFFITATGKVMRDISDLTFP